MNRSAPRLKPLAVRFVLLFFLWVAAFSLAVQIPWIRDRMVVPYTAFLARISSHILTFLGYPSTVLGTTLAHESFTVEIRRGCDGLEAAILLISACLAYPSRWKSKLLGTLLGFALIFMINLVRIVVLSYIGFTGTEQSFDFAHVYVAQFAVIAVTMVFWIFWAGKQEPLRS